ncbi:hypothetical protein HA402_015529 [Bradysia odoriphaga]|nr:hypothetical protein HA402_015529 [Bradysia odoriphaga]
MANYVNLMMYIQENGINPCLLSGLSELQVDSEAIPNDAVIDYAIDMGYLYGDREEDFLRNIQSWRSPLSSDQLQWLRYINRRIRLAIVVKGDDSEDEWCCT